MFMLKCLWSSLSMQRWNQEGSLTVQDPTWTLAEPSSIFGNVLPEARSLWIGTIQIWSLSLCWNQGDLCCPCKTSSFGAKTHWRSIAQQYICGSLVLTLNRKMTPLGSWNHVGMWSRNKSAWNEANQSDELSYWSTWIKFWTCQRQAHSIRIQTVGQ